MPRLLSCLARPLATAGLVCALPTTAALASSEPVEGALTVDVTERGFGALSDTLPSLVPTELDVPDIEQSGRALRDWTATARNIDIDVDVRDLQIVPRNGYLLVSGQVGLQANSESDPANIRFVYDAPSWLGGPWTLADCGFWLRPVTVDVETRVFLDVVEDAQGNRTLDATLSSVSWSWTLRGTDLQADDCWLGAINDILEFVNFSLFDLLLGPIEGLVDDQVQALVADLEPTLEDAFNSFALDETFTFNDADLRVSLEPSDVIITESGLRLETVGLADAELADCVADQGDVPFVPQGAAPPAIGDGPLGEHDVAVLGNPDFVNQALYAAYRGGGLCFALTGEQGDLPINTLLLSLLAPGSYDELFPETRPMVVEVRPTSPPIARPDGPQDITVEARDLALDLYAELDGRQALVVGIDLDLDAGAELDFDGTTGALDLGVDLSGDDLTAEVRTNEFVPAASEQIPDRVGDLFDQLAAPILGDALSGLSFQVPAFAGFGLQTLDASPTGAAGAWFGFYADAGQVPYGSGGCNDAGGCGDAGGEGCDQGCSATAGGRGAVLVALPMLVALLRRRRR
jgi:hypothetical protein